MGKTYKNIPEYSNKDERKNNKSFKPKQKPKYKKYLSED